MLSVISRVVVLAIALASFGGCSSTPEPAVASVRHARDYFPLAVGNTWVYRSVPSREDVPPDEIVIVSKDADGFFIDNHGSRLQSRATGIFDGDRFILEDPLNVGHEWLAVPSASVVERFNIVEVDAIVTVPAGRFTDCVRVRAKQEGPTPDGNHKVTLTMTWTYAPGVGLVELVSRAAVDDGAPQEQGRRELVRFTLVDASDNAKVGNAP
jgi:hypothetical protein